MHIFFEYCSAHRYPVHKIEVLVLHVYDMKYLAALSGRLYIYAAPTYEFVYKFVRSKTIALSGTGERKHHMKKCRVR